MTLKSPAAAHARLLPIFRPCLVDGASIAVGPGFGSEANPAVEAGKLVGAKVLRRCYYQRDLKSESQYRRR